MLRRVARGVASVGVVVLAAVAGLAAAVAAALVTEAPALVIASGLVAVFLVGWGGLALLLRSPRRRARLAAVGAAAALTAVAGVAVAVPTGGGPPAPPVAGQAFWQLPSGSRIRYVHLRAEGTPRAEPVVFLHGGPGVPDMAGDAAYFHPLTDHGFDVYVYDQLGAGRSSRLSDPRGYSV
ncbi:MAG TPA: alpha/beta fold hydrolase, partial [Egibacteraceae bacterium]